MEVSTTLADKIFDAADGTFKQTDRQDQTQNLLYILQKYFTCPRENTEKKDKILKAIVSNASQSTSYLRYAIAFAVHIIEQLDNPELPPILKERATELLNSDMYPENVRDFLTDLKIKDFSAAPAAAAFTAGATLLKDGTSPGVMQKLGIDKDTAVQVTVKDGDMTITTGMQGGAAAHSDHLSGGASRQVIISALQTLLKQSGAELLPDEAFTKMSTEALAETVVDLTRVRHNF